MQPTHCRLVKLNPTVKTAVLFASLAVMSVPTGSTLFEANQTSVALDRPHSPASFLLPSHPSAEPGASETSMSKSLNLSEAEVNCTPSPLCTKVVDPSTYEFGCKEIEEMLEGPRMFLGKGLWREAFLVDYKSRQLVVKTTRERYKSGRRGKRVDSMSQREASALAAVRGHPHVVNMLGVCNISSTVNEYFGDSVEALLDRSNGRALPFSQVLPMAVDLARGLQALHEAPGGPIVHFDIKSQNLLLDKQGGLKINDLNACRFMATDHDGHTCPFEPLKLRYKDMRAPEIMAGEVGKRRYSNPERPRHISRESLEKFERATQYLVRRYAALAPRSKQFETELPGYLEQASGKLPVAEKL